MTRRAGFVALLLAAVLVGAYVTAARRTTGPPLDPGSTAPDGARGVVELVDRFGAGMTVLDGVPDGSVDTALVLRDRFDRESAAALQDWVRGGGTLVVADPSSALTPPVVAATSDVVRGDCLLPAFQEVHALDVGADGRHYDVPVTAAGCFGPGEGSVVVVETLGRGSVVSVGGPGVFTNELLDEEDNAVLAVSLLAPSADTRSAFLRTTAVGTGDDSLVDLVGDPVRAALAQLLVAFLVVALWRARRLGRPVREPQLVAIESSELTRAVGRLLERSGSAGRAAAVLRDRARRELSGPLGVPLDASQDVVVSVLAANTGLSADEVRRAVAAPVTTDEELVVVATLLARIRQEVTHGRQHPTPV